MASCIYYDTQPCTVNQYTMKLLAVHNHCLPTDTCTSIRWWFDLFYHWRVTDFIVLFIVSLWYENRDSY